MVPKSVYPVRELEYQAILELSGSLSVALLCKAALIPVSSFYHWKRTLFEPSERAKAFAENVALFRRCHALYPSHGYRWFKAKIRMDTGKVLSDLYAHKCCWAAGIKSKSSRIKRRSYRSTGIPTGFFPTSC